MFGLSNLADKDFVVGYVLPVLIAGAAVLGLFHDVPPLADAAIKLVADSSFANVTLIVLAIWTVATLLMAWNHQIYRLLEGYTGPLARESWRSKIRAQYEERMKILDALYAKTDPNPAPAPAANYPAMTTVTSADAAEGKSFAGKTLFILTTWTFTTLLMTLAFWISQLLKRYRNPISRERWRSRIRAQYEKRRKILDLLYTQAAVPEIVIKDPLQAYVQAEAAVLREFPKPEYILPTRFGNVIRAFETYPNRIYGVDGITVWTRLIGVVPASYAEVLNAARAEVTFWVNICFLAVPFCATALLRAVLDLFRLTNPHNTPAALIFAVEAAAAALIAYLSYRCATERATAWGETVKGAFDLYLPSLAKQLGYALPTAREGDGGQLEFWDAVSAMFVIENPIEPKNWKPASSADEKEAMGTLGGAEGSKREGDEGESAKRKGRQSGENKNGESAEDREGGSEEDGINAGGDGTEGDSGDGKAAQHVIDPGKA